MKGPELVWDDGDVRAGPRWGRVEAWRASVRVRWLFRRFRSGPQSGSYSTRNRPDDPGRFVQTYPSEYRKPMNGSFKSSGRIVSSDQAVPNNLKNETLNNRQFVRLVAYNKKFVGCSFRNTTFEVCYLRKCTFDSCDFSGCHFDRCKLPGTSFQECKFDYATFERTLIEPEILKTGCPSFENLQMRFARSLRINYQELGDSDATNEAILVELAATEIHLKKAVFSRDYYYRSKYKGFRRAVLAVEFAKFKALDIIWGNGEKINRLIMTLFFVLVCMAVFDVLNYRNPKNVDDYIDAIVMAPQVLVGVASPIEFSAGYLSIIAIIRFVVFTLFVSIILKRFHRR